MTALQIVRCYPHYSPLLIPWLDAYWAEGPDFAAAGFGDGAAIDACPSEGSRNTGLVQATAGLRPTFVVSSNLNGRRAFRFDGGDNLNNTLTPWTAIAAPFTTVCIFKLTTLVQGTTYVVHAGRGSTTRCDFLTATADTPDSWWIYQGTGTVDSGGVANADTNAHLAVISWTTTDVLELDGTSVASGDAGTHSTDGVVIGASFQGVLPAIMDLAFWAVIDRALTTPEKADLLAWSRFHYGTT